MGIGHTRWATHGGVTAANAHPHVDCTGRIAVVHNGIIENHTGLRADLRQRGHRFASDTDTEVVAHLVEDELAAGMSLASAVARVFDALQGYNAIVVMDRDENTFAAAKRVSPLVIGRGKSSSTIASDAIALHGHADRLVFLEDDQLAIVSGDNIDVFDRASMRRVQPISIRMQGRQESPGHPGHPDFLSKEVSEQPAVLRRLVRESGPEIAALADAVRSASEVIFVGCGTAGNAALAGSYLFGTISGRQVSAVPASEFRYRSRALCRDALVVAISQSGETTDVLDAVCEAQHRGARLAVIVNTRNSTLDRMVETSVHLDAGVEQCVLATKTYTAMVAALLLTACQSARRWDDGVAAVDQAALACESALADRQRAHIRAIAARLAAAEHLFTIGRGVHFASALEAALKIKEVSYIHAEGFAGGELKHGVIALVESGTPCIVFAPRDDTRTDVISGAAELRSRGAFVIGIGSENDPVFDEFIPIPDAGLANPIAQAVAGQLLGYELAIARGNDPDRPRNLAKSVTVK
jgi:glucosamine--fructose-6-phosphate aminotransferase (isomerizing)